jgi:phospholipid-binding lipoprotein MlaA
MQQRSSCRVLGLIATLACLAGPAFAEEVPPPGATPAPVGGAPAFEPQGADPHFDDLYDEGEETEEVRDYDPLEPMNRAFFAFNRGLDFVLIEPITRGYEFVVPEPARDALFRAFRNVNSPVIFVNDLLQLRFRDAAETAGRFLLNSTLGAGGLFDAGRELGWEHHDSDFGQTLGRYGVASGPYLVVPLLGPSSLRDGIGQIIDGLFQPLTYLIGPGQLLTVALPIGGGRGLTLRSHHSEELEALEESSVDFYAAMRSAYLQARRAKVLAATNGSLTSSLSN